MPVREFIKRHRIASAVVAPATLGVAAVVAASWALLAAPKPVDTRLTASVTECHDMVTISVAGRNDSPNAATTKMLVDAQGNALPAALSDDYQSKWVDPVVNAPATTAAPGSYAAVYVAYPANMNSYEDAVTTGVTNTEQVMRDIAVACPGTKFSIVGYSEGADVVRRVATQVGHQDASTGGDYAIVDPSRVLGVVILADAGRAAGEGPFPGAKDPNGSPDGFDQKYRTAGTPTPGQGAVPGNGGDFGALNGKIASFCSDGDMTCSAPRNISLLQLAANVGRQLNVDALQQVGLTPATGQDVAVVLGRIAIAAFEDIRSQPNWMQSNETFLQVLLRVSDPTYKPGTAPAATAPAQSISTTAMSPLAYLPQKVFNEIVGLIVTNQNTIPVIMSDPYQQTLGPNGHHFDYWSDADPANGKPLTSAQYAAAWLTYLSKQAQAGKQVDTTTAPPAAELAAAYREVEVTAAQTNAPAGTAVSGKVSEKSTTTTPVTSPTTTPATAAPPARTPSSTPVVPPNGRPATAQPIDSTPGGTMPTSSAQPPVSASAQAVAPSTGAPASPAQAAAPTPAVVAPASPAPAPAAVAPAKPAFVAPVATATPAAPVAPARTSTTTTESVIPEATAPGPRQR